MRLLKGDKVWDKRRRAFATVQQVVGAALNLEDEAGAQWSARAENCMPAAHAVDRAAPPGTTPIAVAPVDVQLHDFVWVAGEYREVLDMRSKAAAGGKVLELAGHGPWVMSRPGTVYRSAQSGARR